MTTTTEPRVRPAPGSVTKAGRLPGGLVPQMLNHLAYVTHDVAATADFYTRILGMELASTIFDEKVPSTGEDFPYFHIFFRMADGSTIAFFECTDLPPAAKASHPAYDTFNHVALQARDRDEIRKWHAWLTQNGIEVLGPVDHKGIIESIYFHDPNGIRLELTTPIDAQWNRHTEQGYKDLALWVETKEKAKREGRNPSEALIEMILATKKARYENKG